MAQEHCGEKPCYFKDTSDLKWKIFRAECICHDQGSVGISQDDTLSYQNKVS